MERTGPIRFFKGLEIEATNNFLLPTMLAVGQYDFDECKRVLDEHNINHILLGYMATPDGTHLDMDLDRAFDLANRLMGSGHKVTMEIRPDQLTDDFVVRCPEPDSEFGEQFVILLGAYFPNFPKIASYTTLKLQTVGGVNGGVWCLSAEKFAKEAIKTPWAAYTMDEKVG